jgi:hypothetical protein
MNDTNKFGEYCIERLDENKLKDIETLHEAVYKRRPAKNYFLKKYNTAYTGVQFIGYLAYNKDKIPTAFFGVIPCFIQYDNKVVLSAQACDEMTLSECRHKGLFVELATMTFDLCRTTGINLLFGFPNQNSYHGFVNRLGWKVTENMELFVIPVNAFKLESLLRNFKWSKWIYKKYARWILHKYILSEPGLLTSIIAQGFGGVYRDDVYLKYKTYSDTQVLKIGNAKVWMKIQNGFVIGDIEVARQDFDKAINAIKKIARHLGVANILFQSSPGIRLHIWLARKYDPVPSFPIIFLDLGADLPLDKLKFCFADSDIF